MRVGAKGVAGPHSYQLFAAAPPVEALQFLVYEAATRDPPTGVSWRALPHGRSC